MDQKRVEDIRDKLDYIAMEGGIVGYAALNAYSMKPCTLLAEMVGPLLFTKVLEEDEAEIRLHAAIMGRELKEGTPDHKAVYDTVKDAIEKVKAAYKASLEAAAVSYVLYEDCDCQHCQSRRQRERAKLS